MTTVSQQQFTCGCCRHTFDDAVINSHGFTSKDSDFRPNYWGMNPLPFFVHACPQCGYTAYDIGCTPPAGCLLWLKTGGLQHEVQRIVDDLRCSGAATTGGNGWLKYLQAALCAEHSGFSHFKLAEIYLRMAWLARDSELQDAERYAQRKALDNFRAALQAEDVPNAAQPAVLYLIGELYRRLAHFQQACARFDAAIAVAERHNAHELLRLAQQQRKLAETGNAANTVIEHETL